MTTMRHDPIDPGLCSGVERPVLATSSARVADRMTHPAIVIAWDEPVANASRLMASHRIRHLPVVDVDRRLVGIVTDGDLAEALAGEGVGDAADAPPALIVGKVMTWNAVAVAPWRDLAEAVTIMYERKLSALPVVEDGRVVGILTGSDILRAYAETVRAS